MIKLAKLLLTLFKTMDWRLPRSDLINSERGKEVNRFRFLTWDALFSWVGRFSLRSINGLKVLPGSSILNPRLICKKIHPFFPLRFRLRDKKKNPLKRSKHKELKGGQSFQFVFVKDDSMSFKCPLKNSFPIRNLLFPGKEDVERIRLDHLSCREGCCGYSWLSASLQTIGFLELGRRARSR